MDTIKPVSDGELLSVLTRLMTPFRREFQQSLDVNRFLVDQEYAMQILEKIQQSDNPSVVSARQFLRDWMQVDSPATPTAVAQANSRLQNAAPPPFTSNTISSTAAAVPSTPDQNVPDSKYVKRLR